MNTAIKVFLILMVVIAVSLTIYFTVTMTKDPSTAPATAPATAPSTAPATAPSTAPATAPSTAPATAPSTTPDNSSAADTEAIITDFNTTRIVPLIDQRVWLQNVGGAYLSATPSTVANILTITTSIKPYRDASQWYVRPHATLTGFFTLSSALSVITGVTVDSMDENKNNAVVRIQRSPVMAIRFSDAGKDAVHIRLYATGHKLLAVAGDGKQENGLITQQTPSTSTNVTWNLLPLIDTQVVMPAINQHFWLLNGSGTRLQVVPSGTNYAYAVAPLRMRFAREDGNGFKFFLTNTDVRGYYYIHTAHDGQFVVNVAGGESTLTPSGLVLYTGGTRSSQVWFTSIPGSNYVTIRFRHSGMFMFGGSGDYTGVIQATETNTLLPQMQWKFD